MERNEAHRKNNLMTMINITLPDGSVRKYDSGVSGLDIARSIGEGFARNVIAAKVNGEVWDTTRPISTDAKVQLLTFRDEDGKATFWHSSAHLMAEALESLYPGVKFGAGPSLENGFYYDIDLGEESLSSNEFEAIEKKMLELARQKNDYIREPISKADAIQYFENKGDEYKLELLEKLEDGSITLYKQGNFTDLCRGPHIPNTGVIKAIKLTKLSGSYWQNNEKNARMTRVYGITFPKAKELKQYLAMIEEAKKRDHRKLGKELELFMFSEKVGQGLPLWLPKGTALRNRLQDFLTKEQIKGGYQLVTTPHIGHKNLYITSGHYEKYGEDSFQPIGTPKEGEEFFLKPMNCPHHCEIYAHKPHSYKELPLRIAEFGTVYRYEQSGELHGLSRVRCFTQDDAHLFCTVDQLEEEFIAVLNLTLLVFRKMGFADFTAQISLRDPETPEKYIGSDENWNAAESAIINAVSKLELNTVTELGEAAFYGPKLDFMVKDALGRSWQLGTIQVDYNLPERFELEYIGPDNAPHRPVMIHRAPFGSLERFISVLIEHTAGKFPLWLTPEQYAILPISDKFIDYAESVKNQLEAADIRGYMDDRNETLKRKIRDAEVKKVPIMIIVGGKDVEAGTVSVRLQGQEDGDKGAMSIDGFIAFFNNLLVEEN